MLTALARHLNPMAQRSEVARRDRLMRRDGGRSALAYPFAYSVRIDAVVVADLLGQLTAELALGRSQTHAVLWATRAGHARLDRAEVQLQRVGENRVGRVGRAEKPLRLAVGFDEPDLRLRASCEAQIFERLVVDREKSDRRAVLG